jgi:O-antigen ligase
MFLAMLLGLLDSPFPSQDLLMFKQAIFYSFLYFLYFRAVQNMEVLKFLLYGLFFTFGLMGLEVLREAAYFGFSGHRSAGAFGDDEANANYAGAYFSLFVPVLVALAAFLRQNAWLRMVAAGVYMLGLLAIFFTYSRQAYMAAALTTFVVAMRKSIGIGIIIIITLANYQLWAPETVIERIEGSSSENIETGEEQLEDSARSRFVIWSAGWEVIKDNPQGIGFNQFQDAIDPYMPDWITARDAHNQFVLVTAENGWLGVLAFLLLILAFLRLGLRLMRAGKQADDELAHLLGLGFAVSAFGIVLANLTSSTFYSGEVMGNYWILAALVARYAVLLEESFEDADEGDASCAE